MRRREFIAGLGTAAAWPFGARAQQPVGMRRLGVLISATRDDTQARRQVAALQEGLRELGGSRAATSTSRPVSAPMTPTGSRRTRANSPRCNRTHSSPRAPRQCWHYNGRPQTYRLSSPR
jgi:hypothetical protein